jgi:two-component system, LuxR family, response regulator FixJ
MSQEPTVFIVDDDGAFRESLSVLMLSMGYKSSTFASGDEFLATFDENRPGCIILDVRMPNQSGLAVQEKLTKFPLCPPIIILTGHAEVPLALRAMRQGAVEFLQKTFTEGELREAIQRAMALDAENRRLHLRKRGVAERLAQLTRPEREVLELVLAGHPNKKIASLLDISQRAVEDRRARVMKKVDVDSLPELVRFAIEAGLKVEE